jgi:hypothetical protein
MRRRERRAEGELANQLRIGGVADVEVDHRGRVAHRGHLAVRADIRGTMKAFRPLRLTACEILPDTGRASPAVGKNDQLVRATLRRHGRHALGCAEVGYIRLRQQVRYGK